MPASLYFLRNRFRGCYTILLLISSTTLVAQRPRSVDVKVQPDPAHRKVVILAGGKPFTEFIYPDTMEKAVLYPIYAPDGQLVTRGYPIAPRAGEPVDHPHHVGLWFTYENVNGLDFWNNSFAIPAEKKQSYGWIRMDSIVMATNLKAKGGDKGILQYDANWTDQQRNVLLQENTILIFTANSEERIIDRSTTLTAMGNVSLPDAKDGLLGFRATRELQIPSSTPGEFFDGKGIATKVAGGNSPEINGNYITSEGKTGDSAWATRGAWCMLYGKKQQDTLSVLIIDHPSNPGYPTYWHARGYGLFAANPLGQKVFSKDQQTMGFKLEKGKSVVFKYRIVIAAGNHRLSTDRIRQLTDAFAQPE